MPKTAPIPQCSEEDREVLERWASSRTLEARLVERARMILQCLDGKAVSAVVRNLQVQPNTMIDWRRRFASEGMTGLQDRPRSGKPRRYTEEFRNQVLATVEIPPPLDKVRWDGPAVATHLHVSVHAVWRVLPKEGIGLSRQRSWCVSTDPEFTAEAADIVGLYLNPPEQALVLSVDEKPSNQALERATGYVETDNGTIVRGLKNTYERHGTLNLFATLEVATRAIRTQTIQKKRRVEFLAFMDHFVSGLAAGKEIHVIPNNYCSHKKHDAWLAAHRLFSFHPHVVQLAESSGNLVRDFFPARRCVAPRFAIWTNYAKRSKTLSQSMARPQNLLSGASEKLKILS